MANPTITLTLPDDLMARARRIAKLTNQPLESVLVSQIEQALAGPLAELSSAEQVELHALRYLSDEALWTIAREQMPAASQTRMQVLMEKNNLEDMIDSETAELSLLVEQGQQLMLRKAQAAALLTERGYTVTPDSMND